MNEIKKHILIDTPTRKKIRKVMGCSTVQVWKALNFRSDSESAKKIRVMALESGGVLIGSQPMSEAVRATKESAMIASAQDAAVLAAAESKAARE